MKQLCIIPCGKKKIWDLDNSRGAVKAKDAYVGTFHYLCEQYATMFFHEWVILSAKHGFLLPEDIVDGNYDVTFNMKSDQIISLDKLRQQIRTKRLDVYQDVVVLTGKKYKPIIYASFMNVERIQFPLLGTKGIGHMQQLLKRSITEQEALHLRC
ncbi:hypothetical protein NC661_09950 [Aquibacillus koreensis]|uniref:DUF6884 domain-containing protein n=1 Tax=Aquibacillus koreensis TaxID=279446 RepID=A0A9X3WL44_9BACI|nr:DUF6884 domain-containing protein [Aquibacillus koreensis]MCT2534265.1 hypothetical protein [Aquibacillus koreensis]MDC3420690.1 hypothetical protein [Aquibacillus koreensis]